MKLVETESTPDLSTLTRDELERLDIDVLDRAAFGHVQGDIVKLRPADIHIKFHGDLVNPQALFDRDGMRWVRSVDFSEPIEISIGRDGKYYLEDGHHRWFASAKLKRKVTAQIIKIDGNPIDAILRKHGKINEAETVNQSETPSFKAWFGQSKVVDKGGRPLRVYHGTAEDIQAFDNKKIGSNYTQYSFGFHFTKEPDEAATYASDAKGSAPNVMPVYLSIQNPIIADSGGQNPSQYIDLNRAELIQKVVMSRRNGTPYDGIIVTDDQGRVNYVVFKSQQIKSAIGNSGSYDPTVTNIDESVKTDPWVFHNTNRETLARIRTEGLTGGSFSRRPIKFSGDAWIAVRLSDLPKPVQDHDYGGSWAYEPSWEPTPDSSTWRTIPADRVYLATARGRIIGPLTA